MKITIVHHDKNNQLVVNVKPFEKLLERMSKDNARQTVTRFRESVPFLDDYRYYKEMPTWRHVYPAAEFAKDALGNLTMKSCSGVLMLLFGDVEGGVGMEKIKRAVATLPSTFAAFDGADGRSVVVLVSYAPQDGALPDTETDAEQLYRTACSQVLPIYQVVAKAPILSEKSSLRDNFLLTLDAKPYYNIEAVPIRVDMSLAGTSAETIPQVAGDKPKAETDDKDSRMGVRDTILEMMKILTDRYEFRYNTVMKYVEYMPKDKYWYGFQPVDARVQNRMTLEVQLADLRVSIRDVRNFLESDYVRDYNPIDEYLCSCAGKWDGEDRIRALARTVPTDNPYWEDWFYTWFLGMVDQWNGGVFRQYGNSVAPLLISKQGYNKSTFCRRLLPPELQWGYNDNLVLSEKRQVYQAMSQFLLINLDEFNQISPQVQQGFLKNLVQLPTLKLKRPYGRHVEEFPRLASFIATSNLADILTDPSGNRRFIGVELTGPIDVSGKLNYQQLYAQALAALRAKDRSYFDAEQVKLIMRNNGKFEVEQPVEQYFHLYFTPAESEEDGQWMSAAEIFTVLKGIVGASLKVDNLLLFGRRLSNMEGLKRKRFAAGVRYLVRQNV